MENSANTSYTFGMATGEILILLLLAFLAGMLLCWLLRTMGICCTRRRTEVPSTGFPVNTLETEPAGNYQIAPSAFDRRVGNLTTASTAISNRPRREPVVRETREAVKLEPVKAEDVPTLKVDAERIKPVVVPPIVPITQVEVAPSPKQLQPQTLKVPGTSLELGNIGIDAKPTVVDVNTVEPTSKDVTGEPLPQFPDTLEFPSDNLTATASMPPAATVEEEIPSDPIEAESKAFFDSLVATHVKSLAGQEPRPAVTLEKPELPIGEVAKATPNNDTLTAEGINLSDIDPHRPIIDDPDEEDTFKAAETGSEWSDKAKLVATGAGSAAAILASTIDPHRPIVDEPEDESEGFFSNALKKLQDTAEKVSDKVESWVDNSKETTHEVGETVEAKTDDATVSLTNQAEATKDAIAEKANELTTDAKDTGDKLADKAQAAAETVKDKTSELVADAKAASATATDKVNEVVEVVKDKAHTAKEAVKDQAHEWAADAKEVGATIAAKTDDAAKAVKETAHDTKAAAVTKLDGIDPHRPIVEEPEEDKPGFFSQVFNQLQDAAERVSDKVEGWVDSAQDKAADLVGDTQTALNKAETKPEAAVEDKSRDTSSTLALGTTAAAASAIALGNIDPHRPIVDEPEENKPGFFNQALNQLKAAAESASDLIEGKVDTAQAKTADLADDTKSYSRPIVEIADDKVTELKAQAEVATDKVVDKTHDAANAVKDTAQEAKDALKEQGQDLADKAQDAGDTLAAKADDAVEAAKDTAQEAKEAVKDQAQDLADKAQDAGDTLAAKADDAVEAAKDTAQEAKEAVKDQAQDLTNKAQDAGDTLAAKAQEAKDALKTKAADVVEGAKTVGAVVADKVGSAVETVKDKVQEVKEAVTSSSDPSMDAGAVNPEAIIPQGTVSTDRDLAASLLNTPFDPNQSITKRSEQPVPSESLASGLLASNVDPHRPIVDEPEENRPGFFSQVLHQLQDTAERVSDKVEGWVDSAQDKSEKLIEDTQNIPHETQAKLENAIEDKPHDTAATTTLGTAAASAIALGSLDPHRPIVDEPQEDKPSFFSQVLTKLQDTAERVSDKVEGWVDTTQDKDQELTQDSSLTDAAEAKAQVAVDKVADKTHDAANAVKDTAQEAKDALKEQGQDLADKAQDAGDTLAAKADDTVEAVKDTAQEAKEAVKDQAQDLAHKAQDAGDTFAAKAQEAKEALKAKAADVVEGAKTVGAVVADKVGSAVETVKDKVQEVKEAVTSSSEPSTDSGAVNPEAIIPQGPLSTDRDLAASLLDTPFDPNQSITKRSEQPTPSESLASGLLASNVDPHRPIVDDFEDKSSDTASTLALGTVAAAASAIAMSDVDPHKPIIDDPSAEPSSFAEEPIVTAKAESWYETVKTSDPTLVSVTQYKPAKTEDDVEKIEASLADKPSTVLDNAKEAAQDTEEVVKDQAQNLAGDATTAGTVIADKASDATEAVKDTAHDAKAAVVNKAHDLADNAHAMGDTVAAKASDAIEAVKDAAHDATAAIADKAQDIAESVTDKTRELTASTLEVPSTTVVNDQTLLAANLVESNQSAPTAVVDEYLEDSLDSGLLKQETKASTASYDPHKPIVDEPADEIFLADSLDSGLLEKESTAKAADYDPHKPIVDDPEDDLVQGATAGGFFSGLLHTALDGVGHLGEKVDHLLGDKAPAAHDLLQKAKDKVEHLGETVDHLSEKATPAVQDWAHKAKDTVDHLVEKAPAGTQELVHKAKDRVEQLGEKAVPVAKSWLQRAVEKVEQLSENAPASAQDLLHKAKGTLEHLGEKLDAHTAEASKTPENLQPSNPLQAESLVKSSATLNELANSTQELTEKLMSNMSTSHNDFKRLYGIDDTIEEALKADGIVTYQQLADALPKRIHSVLERLGEQYRNRTISSWFVQANLAAQNEWNILDAYQRELKKNDNAL